MATRTVKLQPAAPPDSNDSELRLEKKLNDVNTFKNSITNIGRMITYFKDKNQISKKKYEEHRTLPSMLETADTVNIIGAITTFVTLTIAGVGLLSHQYPPELHVFYH